MMGARTWCSWPSRHPKRKWLPDSARHGRRTWAQEANWKCTTRVTAKIISPRVAGRRIFSKRAPLRCKIKPFFQWCDSPLSEAFCIYQRNVHRKIEVRSLIANQSATAGSYLLKDDTPLEERIRYVYPRYNKALPSVMTVCTC